MLPAQHQAGGAQGPDDQHPRTPRGGPQAATGGEGQHGFMIHKRSESVSFNCLSFLFLCFHGLDLAKSSVFIIYLFIGYVWGLDNEH